MAKMARAGSSALKDSRRVAEASGSFPGQMVETSDAPPEPSGREPAPLSVLLATMASMRAEGALLFPSEWAAYQRALDSGRFAERMAVASEICGTQEEAAFWMGLTPTLAALRSSLPASFTHQAPNSVLYTDPQTGISAYRRTSGEQPRDRTIEATSNGAKDDSSQLSGSSSRVHVETAVSEAESKDELWSEKAQIVEARERAQWHERMSRSNHQQSEALQERRVLEYIVLGDLQTAVGYLLASTPDRSARYYRDALCTLALATAAAPAAATDGGPEAVSRSLHVQVAKVVAAHSASAGDNLMGVPLLCSAGLFQEAVGVLQDGGLWSYAATLAARALPRRDQAAPLERWAVQTHQAAGSLWKAMGVLTAAGSLRNSALLLRKLGAADCAAAFVQAATEAGFGTSSGTSDAGGLDNWHHTGNTLGRQRSFSQSSPAVEAASPSSVDGDFEQLCIQILQHL